MTLPNDFTPDPQPDLQQLVVLAQRQSFFRTVRWRWVDVIIGLLPILMVRGCFLFQREAWRAFPQVVLLAAFLTELWLLIIPLWLLGQRDSTGTWRFPRASQLLKEVAWAFVFVIILYVLLTLASLMAYFVFGERALPVDVLAGARNQTDLPFALVLFLIFGFTVAPIAEEVFCRGVMYNAFRQWMPPLLALVLQALVFAILHPYPFVNLLYLLPIGLFLGFLYDWRKTLWAPILAHIFFNALVIGLLFFSVALNARSPVLGVVCTDRLDESGCQVTWVLPGSAAEKSGLKVNDLIVGFDGVDIHDFRHLIEWIRSREIGQEVTIQFYREGILFETKAILQKRE